MNSAIDSGTIPQRKLSNGMSIPAIGLGTFGSDRYSAEQVAAAVGGAIRAGYRLFDCASVYGNEQLIGQVIEQALREGVVRREELTITSKVWNDMHGKGDVLLSCAKSLKDLRLDVIDIYFVHWPFPNYHAPGCSGDARNPDSRPFFAEEFLACWRQMERLVDMGLVRSIGMSNMTIPKLEAVLPHCRIQPATIEMELHPTFQQPELFDYCVARGIQPIGYCPIGSPNRPDRDKTETDYVDTEEPAILAAAKAHGVHPAVICLKWAAQRGQIPIPFTVHEANYAANLRSVTQDPLSEEEMRAISQSDRDCRLIKGQVFLWEGAKDWTALWDMDGSIAGWHQN